MKRLALVATFACVGSALALLPGLQATASAPHPAPSLVAQLKAQASGTTKVSVEKATGAVGFVRTGAGSDLLPGRAAVGAAAVGRKADAYLTTYAEAFGAAWGELRRTGVTTNEHGYTVRYEQRYAGVPVFGSRLLANFDEAGHLRAVNGYVAPGLDLATTPRLTKRQAAEAAVAHVRRDPPTSATGGSADLTGIRAVDTRLVIYRTGVTRGVEGVNTLAYAVQVTNKANVNDTVILRADSPKVLNRWSLATDALARELWTCDGVDVDGSCKYTPVWQEGDPTAGLDGDQANLLDSVKETYWLFGNAFDRDSYDDEGGTMVTVHNSTSGCPNASWNYYLAAFCPGLYSDDVVAHEWGHAYTAYTSGLIYQWQSGAVDESYSDVWGETLDLLNGREDAGEGDLDAKRPDGECSTHMRTPLSVTITAPAAIAGPCAGAAPAAFGPRFTPTPTVADVVVATDTDTGGPLGGGTFYDGCSTLRSAQAVEGTWAYLDRGGCSVGRKVEHVVEAGYEGLVVGKDQPGAPTSMTGGVGDLYAVMVTEGDGVRIKQQGEATISVVATPPGDRTESFRWLMGEQSPALGGAIRDMWHPSCGGDPGKVSDAEYHCGFDDEGGVHTNSGVPNHAYSLTVDGGDYNGRTVRGIGLDKAAAIWFRAQSQYLTPVSDFPDLGNALAASCADLVDHQVRKLSVEAHAPEVLTDPVTSDDCAQLGKAIVATELSSDAMEQCGYEMVLDPDAPSVCGAGFSTRTVWSEDFHDGLAGWFSDEYVRYDEGLHAPWEVTSDAPGRHDTESVAYAPMPDGGQCSEGEQPGDFSSRDSIISPEVTVPNTGQNPLLSFDHHIASEWMYDAGSLSYSINGGSFTAAPPSAYVHNPPTVDQLPPVVGGYGNTNPLVGSPAWTGADEGTTKSSWGQTQVSLTSLGAGVGDRLRFRFDAGRDGCSGVDGWYVDNVTVTICEPKPSAPPPAPAGPGTTTPPTSTTPATPSTTRTTVKKPAHPPTYKKDFTVTVTVTAPGLTPTGQVVLRHRGDTIGSGLLVDGKVRIKVRKNLRVGKHPLLATYEGSSTTRPSKRRFTIRVVKA